MNDDVEVPDLRFWGLVVNAGKPATYSIQNEHGLLELCHVTNVALQSTRTRADEPVYVRIRSPDQPQAEYTLGALIPGKLYSFSTDLMISPDTQFSHTGTEGDQVHLTGYRSINVETMLMDDEEEQEVSSSDEEGAGPRGTLPGRRLAAAAGGVDDDDSEDDEDYDAEADSAEESDDEGDEDLPDILQQGQEKRRIKPQRDSSPAQARQIVGGSVDEDEDGQSYDDESDDGSVLESDDLDMLHDMADEDDDEAMAVPRESKAADVAKAKQQMRKVQAAKQAQRMACAEQEDAFEDLDGSGIESDEDSDGESIDEDAAALQQARALTPSKGAAKHGANGIVATKQAGAAAEKHSQAGNKKAARRTADTDLNASPVTPAAKKHKAQPPAASGTAASAAAPASTAPQLAHPADVSEDTKQYATSLVQFLRKHEGKYSLSKVGQVVQRPPRALKLGKLMQSYPSLFERQGTGGQEEIKLKQ